MQTAQQKFDKELAALRASSAAAEDANAKLSRELSEARDEIAKVHSGAHWASYQHANRVQLKELVQQKEEARQNAQNELDDLLIVLNDLEEQKINLEVSSFFHVSPSGMLIIRINYNLRSE